MEEITRGVNTYITAVEMAKQATPTARWINIVCQKLFLSKNIISEKSVMAPEMIRSIQPDGKQRWKENEPCKKKDVKSEIHFN